MDEGLYDRLKRELEAREKSPGLTMADILNLPDPLGPLCSWMLRAQQVSLSDVASFLGQDESQASRTLADLLSRGFVREVIMPGATYYRVRLAPRRKRAALPDLWRALEDTILE